MNGPACIKRIMIPGKHPPWVEYGLRTVRPELVYKLHKLVDLYLTLFGCPFGSIWLDKGGQFVKTVDIAFNKVFVI